MKNYMVTMSFRGTNYHGFQRQDGGLKTIQGTVEDGIYRLLGEHTEINGCSRTDAGVHANEFVFSVMLQSPITERGIVFGLNGVLPKDIAITSCKAVGDDFHARYSCKGKQYIYLIHNSEIRSPFYEDTVFRSWYPIDDAKLNKACKDFIGTHDFKSFCSTDTDKTETVRTVFDFSGIRICEQMAVSAAIRAASTSFWVTFLREVMGALPFLFVNLFDLHGLR